MPNALDVFTVALAVFGAAALVFNLHKYGIDPTLAAIAKWVVGAEKTIAADAQKVYHAAAADLGEALARVEKLSTVVHSAATAALAAAKATATAPAAAPPPAPVAAPVDPPPAPAPVPVAQVAIDPARALLTWLNDRPLSAGNLAWLSSMNGPEFGEWCAAVIALPGTAATPGVSVGWLQGLSQSAADFLVEVSHDAGRLIPSQDPR